MEPVKVILCLDMNEGRVVEGVHFVNLHDAGDPVKNAEFYQAEGADELAMLDIAATLENRKTRLEWVRALSEVVVAGEPGGPGWIAGSGPTVARNWGQGWCRPQAWISPGMARAISSSRARRSCCPRP